jgi:hypothetical protein
VTSVIDLESGFYVKGPAREAGYSLPSLADVKSARKTSTPCKAWRQLYLVLLAVLDVSFILLLQALRPLEFENM